MKRDDEVTTRQPTIVLLLVLLLLALAALLAVEILRGARVHPSLASVSPHGKSFAAMGEAPFRISGSIGRLAPGMTKEIRVMLTNPSTLPIYVTSLTVRIAPESTPSGCSSAANMVLHQATAITSKTPVRVPAHRAVTVTRYPRAPELSFENLHTSQNACKNKSFTLVYTGTAHS